MSPARLTSARRRPDGALAAPVARYLLSGDLDALAARALAAPVAPLPRGAKLDERLAHAAEASRSMRDRAAQAWSAHGAALTAAWARLWPASRPWAWWTWTAPGRRAVVGGEKLDGSPMSLGEACAWAARAPAWSWRFGAAGCMDAAGSVVHETERAFLERHGLLDDDEAAFADEVAAQAARGEADPLAPLSRRPTHRALVVLAALGYADAEAELLAAWGLDLGDPMRAGVAEAVASAIPTPSSEAAS